MIPFGLALYQGIVSWVFVSTNASDHSFQTGMKKTPATRQGLPALILLHNSKLEKGGGVFLSSIIPKKRGAGSPTKIQWNPHGRSLLPSPAFYNLVRWVNMVSHTFYCRPNIPNKISGDGNDYEILYLHAEAFFSGHPGSKSEGRSSHTTKKNLNALPLGCISVSVVKDPRSQGHIFTSFGPFSLFNIFSISALPKPLNTALR